MAMAEYPMITPKMMYSQRVSTFPPMNAPVSAPLVVAISRTMATRRLAMCSFTYAAAAPLEVAMTETTLAPMA